MLKSIKRSNTIKYLLAGFSIAAILFSLSWFITASQMKDHLALVNISEKAANKMNVVAGLVEISQKRIRLSHQLILTRDVFEKDEITQSINALAGEFILKRRELLTHSLSKNEIFILQGQRKFYPIIIDNLNNIAELSLLGTTEADTKATNILFNEVVPAQGRVIEGFMQLMNISEEEINHGSFQIVQKHQIHQQVRDTLLLSVLITTAFAVFLVIKNVLKVENRLYDLSRIDALTDVQNRRSFDEQIAYEWKRGSRSEKCLSLLLIDIDYFKQYNDRYGHQEGDACLNNIANILKSIAHRSDDTVARYGGEEFAIILPNVDKDGASRVSERLLERVRTEHIPHLGSDVRQYVTISIGQSSLVPSMDHSYMELIRNADRALYQSKGSGRNRVTRYSSQNNGDNVKMVDFS